MKKIILYAAAAATALALMLCGCFSGNAEERYSSPIITLQPSDVCTESGQPVAFETAAEGDGLTYQWYYKKYNSPRWHTWNGHTTSKTFAIANPTWNGMRVYCRITDSSGGSKATRPALISLNNPPVITSQPRSVTVTLGETAYFRVEATGNGKLNYQWYYKKNNSRLWTKWRGHTLSETEAVSNNSWNGMQVFCIVTDSTGSSVSSEPASINVIDSPTVISQPESRGLSEDGDAAFTVNGGTEGLAYQWFYIPKAGKYGIEMKDRNEDVLSIASADTKIGTQVYCRLNCPGGSTVASEKAEINPAGAPLITFQPQPVAAKTGDRMYFSVRASGNSVRYQWYIKTRNSIGWFPLAEQTRSDISLTASQALSGGEIRCEVTDSNGNKTTSLPAGITVSDKTDITTQPEDLTVSSGEEVKIRIATSAESARFQWYSDKGDGFGWKTLAGQTDSEFIGIADSSWHGMKIKCVITADGSAAVSSRAATITVNDILSLKSSPTDVTAQSGDRVNFSVKATGRDLKYQWMRMDNGSENWVSWKGQNKQSTELPAERSWHRMKVRCDISDCTGKRISSDTADVWITDALDILRQPQSISVRAYELTYFSVVAQGKGLQYQWYYKKRGMSDWHIWKKHTAPYTSALSNSSWDGMQVMCVITDAYGEKISSASSVITIRH